jgi:hypothetical protein
MRITALPTADSIFFDQRIQDRVSPRNASSDGIGGCGGEIGPGAADGFGVPRDESGTGGGGATGRAGGEAGAGAAAGASFDGPSGGASEGPGGTLGPGASISGEGIGCPIADGQPEATVQLVACAAGAPQGQQPQRYFGTPTWAQYAWTLA